MRIITDVSNFFNDISTTVRDGTSYQKPYLDGTCCQQPGTDVGGANSVPLPHFGLIDTILFFICIQERCI